MATCPECHSNPCDAVRYEEVFRREAEKSHDWPLTNIEKRKEMEEAYQRMVERKMGKGMDMLVPGCVCSLFDDVINNNKEEQDNITDLGFPIPNPSNPSSAYTAEYHGPNPGNLMCQYCKSDPCHTFTYGDTIKEHADLLDHDEAPNILRKALYQAYVREMRGGLGKGVRVVVPKCVADIIRDIFPDPNRH